MSKPKKAREKPDTKGKDTTGKSTLPLAIGVLVIVAIIVVVVYLLFMPGTSSSPAGHIRKHRNRQQCWSGDRKSGLGILYRYVYQRDSV